MLSYRAKKPNVRRRRLRNVLSLSARIGVWKVAVKDIHANARYELGQELVTSPGTSLAPLSLSVPNIRSDSTTGHRVSDRISIPDRVESRRVVALSFLLFPQTARFSTPRLWPSFNPSPTFRNQSRILFPSNLVKKRGERKRE